MSSNYVYPCYYCRNKINSIIKELYGKIPAEDYDELKTSSDLDRVLEIIPEEYKDWINGNISRIEGSDLDYDYFESWGDGVFVNSDGNMMFHVSGACDLCGKGFHYEVILPENSESGSEKKIDLTKGKYVKNSGDKE